MSLEEFKSIFWMEWAHRQLGRGIGLAFAVPFGYFALRGYVRGPLALKLSAILVGIGLQGALGWYMVKSGLEHDINVPRVWPQHLPFLSNNLDPVSVGKPIQVSGSSGICVCTLCGHVVGSPRLEFETC